MCIIYKASKIRDKKYKQISARNIKMLNLLKSELRFKAEKRSINGYKSLSKNDLIDAINTSKPAKSNKRNIFKSKRKEIKKSLMKPSNS